MDKISVNIISISGTINEPLLYDDTTHEIMHIYDQIKSNKSYFDDVKFNDYQKTGSFIQHNDINTSNAAIGRLFYLLNKDERIAFINGFNSMLNKTFEKNPENISNFLYKNYILDKIIDMRNTLTQLMNKNEQYINSFNEVNNTLDYPYTLEKLISDGEKALKDLCHRYGNVILNFKNEHLIEYRIFKRPLISHPKNDFLIL